MTTPSTTPSMMLHITIIIGEKNKIKKEKKYGKNKTKKFIPSKKERSENYKSNVNTKRKTKKKNRTKNTPILKEKQRTRKTLDEFTV